MLQRILKKSLASLDAYTQSKLWKGHDPYDALSSPILMFCSFNNSLLRAVYTQVLKRIPFNARKSLAIKEGYNPKGMGLFLSSYIVLYKVTGLREYLYKAQFFIDWLIDNSSNAFAGSCWGYNFHWQSRALFAPAGTPTIVNTCFIANAFLDVYEVLHDGVYLEIARSSCDFIIKSLNVYRTDDEKICFSYTPLDNMRVHNANLLAASLLSRVYSFSGESILLDYSNRAVDFCISHQNEDGSWYYGLGPSQNWIDSFHTGFVLESLYDYARFSGRPGIIQRVKSGLDYYCSTFFTKSGLPKYYDTKAYPIDIHNAAEGIIVFTRLRSMKAGNLERARKIALWAINNMQDSTGYFYYQRHKYYCNKIPYMRWSQAWMFKALVYLSQALEIIPAIGKVEGEFTTE